MATTVPTTDPTELRAGDTWQWRREDLSDYPASAWTLTWYFRNATHFFDVVAGSDGDNFSVSIAKATTAARVAGTYDVVSVVSNATERHEIGRSIVVVTPDFSAAAAVDGRSFARAMLDHVEAALLNRATKDQLDVIEATMAGRGMKRTPATLITLRSQLKAEISREESAAGIRAGKPARSRVMIRFNNV